MTFDVSADAYGRFMGRFSEPLAAEFVARLEVRPGLQVLDVGCGPGALTAALVGIVGAGAVAAIDPSESFVAAARARFPDLDVRCAAAERLPFDDDRFDLAVAQLVVHFMADPESGLTEMARVTRPGGRIAACVWDHAGPGNPLSVFVQARRDLDPHARDESGLPGSREGQLAEMFARVGLHDVEATALTVRVQMASFDDWWEPFTLGVGPAGSYVAGLDASRRQELRAHCAELLPPAPFVISASAWTAIGRV